MGLLTPSYVVEILHNGKWTPNSACDTLKHALSIKDEISNLTGLEPEKIRIMPQTIEAGKELAEFNKNNSK